MTMNQKTRITPQWPLHIEPGPDGSRVVLGEGASADLDRFRDDCRRRAAELRQDAIDDAFKSVFAASRKAWLSSVGLLRAALTRDPAVKGHRA
jgi:hypothetical protein